MKRMIAFLLVLYGLPCFAQKWIDDNGKVYYGDPPQGINVRSAPMTGGTMSSVGPQQPAPGRGNPAATKPDNPKHPYADETDMARAQKEAMDRHMRENAAKFAPDKDFLKSQQEKFQESQRRAEMQQRRQDQETCRATGRRC